MTLAKDDENVLSGMLQSGKKLLVGAALAGSLLGAGALSFPQASAAADAAATGLCLLKECRGELAQCVLNPK